MTSTYDGSRGAGCYHGARHVEHLRDLVADGILELVHVDKVLGRRAPGVLHLLRHERAADGRDGPGGVDERVDSELRVDVDRRGGREQQEEHVHVHERVS